MPREERSWEEKESGRTEMWGLIWDRKYIQSKKEFQCLHMRKVTAFEVASRQYWLFLCPRIPSGMEYARFERWDGVVDYFKPVEGSSLCQMLTSNNQHLWSADGRSWVKPPYAEDDEESLGGSGPLPDELSAQAGGRKSLASWGHERYSGGCCSEWENHTVGGWVQEFDFSLCARPEGDIAKVIDIFVKRLATPWTQRHDVGNWESGLPAHLVKRLDSVIFWKPPPVHRRWAVPVHTASTARAQCLDYRSPLTMGMEPGKWRHMVAVSCCDMHGNISRPTCATKLPWGEAASLCGRFGLRLCTRRELEHSETGVGPCITDQVLHWTVDECEGPVECLGPTVKVHEDQVANRSFWEEKCKMFPPGAEFVRLVMGGIVDYFKPTYGHTLCDMLLSKEKHLWSNNGILFYRPTYSEDSNVVGGSHLGWKLLVDMIQGGLLLEDSRYVLSHWGHTEVPGGCCKASRAANAPEMTFWGLPFLVTSCVTDPGALHGDPRETAEEVEKVAASGKASCPKPVPLVGTRDAKRIPDRAITASSYAKADYSRNMWRARLDSKEDSWSPKGEMPGEWIQWDFGRPVLVTAIQLSGNSANYHWVRTFDLSYINDDVANWTSTGRIYAGNVNHDGLAQRSISPPVLATKIRLTPLTWHGQLAVRADFLGCEPPNEGGGGLLLGPACQGVGCASMATCPMKQWPRYCQTEPVDAGAGAFVYAERSCVARSDGGPIQARLLCGTLETESPQVSAGRGKVKEVRVSCPSGAAPLSCNCVGNHSVSEDCGGEAEFLPSGKACSKTVPRGTSLSAICPVAAPPPPAKAAPAAPEGPRIVLSSPGRCKECAAENVLADDGDVPGRTWIGMPFESRGWFVMDLGQDQAVGGFAIRNTLNHFFQDAWTKNYTIEASADMKSWSVAAEGELAATLDLVHVESAVSAMRYITFTYHSGNISGGLGYFAPLGPEEMSKLGAPMNGSKCIPPPGWCSDTVEMYSEQDCDGDGILDPHCTNGRRLSGFLSSAQGCTNTWPQGGCKGTCKRPLQWCGAELTYSEMDCDGDGIVDPFCEDSLKGDIGFIGSKSGCEPNHPQQCGDGLCVRPEGFCVGETEMELTFEDCDFDGVLDLHCRHNKTGTSGFISSRDRCKSTWPFGGCHGSCRRPIGWCIGEGQLFDDSKDLDGDGIPDLACTQWRFPDHVQHAIEWHKYLAQFYVSTFPDLNPSGFISSLNACADTRHVGGVCRTPMYWCQGGTYREMDCDGDGLLDAYCKEGGKSGFVSSAYDCASTWPHGACGDGPKLWKVFLDRMQCVPNGATCKCTEMWCNYTADSNNITQLSRKDVDKDRIVDIVFTWKARGFEMDPLACGVIASGRMCLHGFPNCLEKVSVSMRVLGMLKELECNLWSPSEIIFLLVTFWMFLFAYGLCECPSCWCCRRKRA